MKTIFINTENSKTGEQRKCVPKLLHRLDLRIMNKQAALEDLSIYYTSKNIKQQYKTN